MILPGWNSLDSVTRIGNAVQIGTLCCWASLVLFEAVAHFWKKGAAFFTALALLAFGLAVVGEVGNYKYGGRKEQLHEDSEKALKQRTAELEAKLVARSLNKEESDKLAAVLRNFPGQKIEIIEYSLSREASSLSKQIQAALVAAKWDAKVIGMLGGAELEPGIHILIAPGQTEFPAVVALVQILKEQGFGVTFRYDAGFSGPVLPHTGVIRMVVGPKP